MIPLLDNNNIKHLNGESFAALKSLSQVWLQGNDCIDENFNNQHRINVLPGYVTNKCGFCENNLPQEIQVCEIAKQVNKIAGENFNEIIELEKKHIEMLMELKRDFEENLKELKMENGDCNE